MKIILASKSGVRKKILQDNNFDCCVVPSNVDEDQVKDSLLAAGANPMLISKNLAELKSIKVSNKNPDQMVLGADSVISLNNELINKPKSREEALKILSNDPINEIDAKNEFNFVCKKLEITENELNNIMQSKNKMFNDYKSNYHLIQFFVKISRFLRIESRLIR